MTNKKPVEVQTSITFRNIESTDALKKHAQEKVVNAIQKFARKDVEAHVVLLVEKNRQIAEVTCHVDGSTVSVKEEDTDLYKAIDKAAGTVMAQLRKNKEKLTQHHL